MNQKLIKNMLHSARTAILTGLIPLLLLTGCQNGEIPASNEIMTTQIRVSPGISAASLLPEAAPALPPQKPESSLAPAPEAELVTMPDSYYTKYKTDGSAIPTRFVKTAESGTTGIKSSTSRASGSFRLLKNPLGLTAGQPECVQKLLAAAPALAERVAWRTDSRNCHWTYAQAKDGSDMVSYTSQEKTAAKTGKYAPDTIFSLLYEWDSTISNDPVKMEVFLMDGLKSVMEGKSIMKKALKGVLHKKYLSIMLDAKGKTITPRMEDSYAPLTNNKLYANIPSSGKKNRIDLYLVRNAMFPTYPAGRELSPSLEIYSYLETGAPNYTKWRKAIPNYKQVMKDSGSKIDLFHYFSNFSLDDQGKSLCQWTAEGSEDTQPVMPASNDYSVRKEVSKEEGDSTRYRFSFQAKSSNLTCAETGLELTDAGGESSVTDFSFRTEKILEADTNRRATNTDLTNAIRLYVKQWNAICPETGFTETDFINAIGDSRTSSTLERELLVQGQAVPCEFTIQVLGGYGGTVAVLQVTRL